MFLSSRLPNRLPPPIQHSNESGFSEGAARALLTHLSGDIGVREQGMTTNEIDTPNFLVETIQSMQAVAQKNGWRLHVEVETNTGTSRSVDTPRSASYPVLSQLLVSHYTTAPSIVEGSQ